MQPADMASPLMGTYAELKVIFNRGCNFSSCHKAGAGGLDLASDKAYCNLVGDKSGLTFRDGAKVDWPHRVVPKDRQKSFLYKKLVLTTAEEGPDKPLGSRMPMTGMSLVAAEIEAFGKWIDQGAQPDDTMTAGPCN